MDSKPFINSKEEFDQLDDYSSHFRPMRYLSKYHFSIQALLDIFCSDSQVFCYEDYYYNDFDLDMVEQTQPHIDIPIFKALWDDLDEIRRVELASDIALDLFEKKVSNRSINKWSRELIYELVDKISGLDKDSVFPVFVCEYKSLISTNKFVVAHSLKIQDELDTPDSIITQAKQILNSIPRSYSSALPLIYPPPQEVGSNPV